MKNTKELIKLKETLATSDDDVIVIVTNEAKNYDPSIWIIRPFYKGAVNVRQCWCAALGWVEIEEEYGGQFIDQIEHLIVEGNNISVIDKNNFNYRLAIMINYYFYHHDEAGYIMHDKEGLAFYEYVVNTEAGVKIFNPLERFTAYQFTRNVNSRYTREAAYYGSAAMLDSRGLVKI